MFSWKMFHYGQDGKIQEAVGCTADWPEQTLVTIIIRD